MDLFSRNFTASEYICNENVDAMNNSNICLDLIEVKLSEEFLYEASAGCAELEDGQEAAHVRVEAEVGEEVRTLPLELYQTSLGNLGLQNIVKSFNIKIQHFTFYM